MKGINNRQKLVVRARENVQKYISQQKNLHQSRAARERTLLRRPIKKQSK